MINDIEKRLKSIEHEQQSQDHELSDIERDFEEIRRLEERLSNINNENIEAKASELANAVMFDSNADARKLEQELKHINEQFKPSQTPATIADEGISSFDDLLFEDDDAQATSNKHGFIIRLLFNKDSPTEWAEEGGGGWRDKGSGHCYPTLEAAKVRQAELQKRWPDYPLDISKR